ncbi:hypothetical protein THARTR1_04684 [Trichoderma harzianum]|uniref:Uncharacterized protein n=1 Tax=Trichoderma harzianum TaxID=5544 RepID=A0A2K0UB36_TRIHA|nr:hypothetical protein THARTR1_04684 [Trichoderma harzianum]
MKCGEFGRLGRNSGLVENFFVSDPLDAYRPTALPDISKLQEICSMITGKPQKFTMHRNATLMVRDLIKQYMDHFKLECRCADCDGTDADSIPESEMCAVEDVYLIFSTILIDIFALSLFEAPKSLLVRPSHDRHDEEQLRGAVRRVLQRGKPQVFEDEHLLQWARGMVGHDFGDEERGLIVTSGRGQVVYPLVYVSGHIMRSGYLRLLNFGGLLKYDGDVYDVVASPDDDGPDVSGHHHVPESKQESGFLQPKNLYQNAIFSWKFAPQENGEIQVHYLIHFQGSNFTEKRNPSFFIGALKDTLFYEACRHDKQAKLERADLLTTNQPPWYEQLTKASAKSPVNIIAVDGSEELRRFAIANVNGPAVSRGDACLRCCLGLYRDTGAHSLIL